MGDEHVAPSRERVLKLLKASFAMYAMLVAPSRERVLKRLFVPPWTMLLPRRSFTGACVETDELPVSDYFIGVAPSRERVLKQ